MPTVVYPPNQNSGTSGSGINTSQTVGNSLTIVSNSTQAQFASDIRPPSRAWVSAAQLLANTSITTPVAVGGAITNATNASPIVITTTVPHTLATGASVNVAGVLGNAAANGTWTITVLSTTSYSLNGSAGSGAYALAGTTSVNIVGTFTGGSSAAATITAATNASPVAITTTSAHNLSTGQYVQIQGVQGNAAANGVFQITVASTLSFTLNGSTGSGAYTSGGQCITLGGSGSSVNGPNQPGTQLQYTAPNPASIAPVLGDATGGVPITLTGNGFTGCTGVSVGGVPCTSFVVVSDTTITAVTPAVAGSPNAYDVLVQGGPTAAGSLFGVLPAAYLSFSPAAYTSIKAWFRADLGTTIATGLSNWVDQSGSGDAANKALVQATATAQPTLNASDAGYNFKPTFSCVATSSQALSSGSWATTLLQPYSVWAVGNFDGTATAQGYCGSIGGGVGLYINSGGTNLAITAGATLQSGVANAATPAVAGGVFNGANSSVYLAANTAKATGNAGTNGWFNMSAGRGATAVFLNGKFAEFVVFGAALSNVASSAAPSVAQLNAYLGTRYNIAIGA